MAFCEHLISDQVTRAWPIICFVGFQPVILDRDNRVGNRRGRRGQNDVANFEHRLIQLLHSSKLRVPAVKSSLHRLPHLLQ